MTSGCEDPTRTHAWGVLQAHAQKPVHMATEFARDPDRVSRLSATLGALTVDLSRNLWTPDILSGLLRLADEVGVLAYRDRLFSGEAVNFTEHRAALHMALRGERTDGYHVRGHLVHDAVADMVQRLSDYATAVRTGHVTGHTGKRFRYVVHIGIGGSDLGPHMAVRALRPYADADLTFHFVSNIDGVHVLDVLEQVPAEETLFIVASKSFATDETISNAHVARDWLCNTLGDEAVPSHFVAISVAEDLCQAFGVCEKRIFGFWDWVGGRYSLWSAVGLPIMLAIGPDHFQAFLAGARDMDRHFQQARPEENIPLLLGLLGVWYRNFLDMRTQVISPYDQRLAMFPAYLQQADMESNGKSVRHDGTRVTYKTGPLVWGEVGTNGQHAFYQLFHQGSDPVALDFLIGVQPKSRLLDHHHKLLANCLAQGEALLYGRSLEQVEAQMRAAGATEEDIATLAPHRVFEGNRPSTTIMYDVLDPYTLGQLIAMYEHKIFVQGAVWGINSYDQWGVELGKVLAQSLLPAVRGEGLPDNLCPSTRLLLSKIHGV